jgi:DNA-binding response OmpR family regulator
MAQKILVVDGDRAARSLLKDILERSGYETLLASTFQEGKHALVADAPDLLIADLRLGEFNGLQLVLMSRNRIPTIMVTAFPDPVLAEEARNLGVGFVTKPFSPTAFLALVREKLEGGPEAVNFSTSRRWARKQVLGELQARVQQAPARILDISYGGLRLEVDRVAGREIPSSFSVTLPTSRLSVQVDLVWKSRTGDHNWLCGAAVAETNQATARAWRGLVDAIS